MNHIKSIQKKISENNWDYLLITDEKNQRYATGFPFTDGFVLVSQENAWLITDSRYYEAALEAVKSLAENDIEVLRTQVRRKACACRGRQQAEPQGVYGPGKNSECWSDRV